MRNRVILFATILLFSCKSKERIPVSQIEANLTVFFSETMGNESMGGLPRILSTFLAVVKHYNNKAKTTFLDVWNK
jgi:hypothetical protein